MLHLFGKKRHSGNMEPPQSSHPFAQVEPPRVQEFEFQRTPTYDSLVSRQQPAGTSTRELSSAPLPVAYMPHPKSVPMVPNRLPATTTKSSVVQEDNIKVTVDEEIESPTLAQNVTNAKTTNRDSRRRKLAKKTPTTHHIEELAIPPNTPTQGLRKVVPPLHNPFASPGLPSDKQLAPMPEKGPQSFSADLSAISPPSTQLHEQNFPMDISEGSDDQPLDWAKYQNTPEYVSKHPICALNLVCYRTGTKGCELHQIQTILESRFEDKEEFQLAIKESPSLIATDAQFFRAIRDVYQQKMCGFWRKALFLKTLRGIRLLSFTLTTRPVIVPLNDFILQELLYAYQNPSKITSEHEWIDWVFRLRQPDRRHALEFVEGWNGTRIAVAGSIPLVVSTMVAIVWSAKGSGVQDGFAVAGFILTAGSLLLALLAIISGIESSSGKRNN